MLLIPVVLNFNESIPNAVFFVPVELVIRASLPTTVFVSELPAPRPILIPFTEISFAVNNELFKDTSPSILIAPLTSNVPLTNTLLLKEESPNTNKRLFMDTSLFNMDFSLTNKSLFIDTSPNTNKRLFMDTSLCKMDLFSTNILAPKEAS